MVEEGYIKFIYDWKKKPIAIENFGELNRYRNKLYRLGLIGAFENGIGFGNISIRLGKSDWFIISGNRTGVLASLSEKHYSKVVEFDFERNWLRCIGLVVASSESLTHAAVYQSDNGVNAVIHVHNLGLWKKLLYKVPTTAKEAEYGTPEMAKEIIRLFKETDVRKQKILVMAGHREGVICFGKNLEEAGKILLRYFKG